MKKKLFITLIIAAVLAIIHISIKTANELDTLNFDDEDELVDKNTRPAPLVF